jgi:RNA polymerase sigma-70 factor (ECF subfamily)
MGALSGLSDNDLIHQFKAGEQAALGVLYTRYTSLVFGTALKYLKDRDEAKDAVMQVFEKLNQSLHQHEVANFKSWLYVTTRNHCLMQLRSRKGKETKEITPNLMESDYVLHLENEPEMEENLSKLEKCIEELGREQQACVKLFYMQEKCYKDVATETGFDLGQVKSFIQNGKRNLKLCMERNG